MSWQAVTYARTEGRERALRSSARLVLLLIAENADRSGVAWPSIETLADDAGLHPANVRRAIREIEAAGIIAVDIGGGHTTNRYRFPLTSPLEAVNELSTPPAPARGVDDADPARHRADPARHRAGSPRGGARRTSHEPVKNQRDARWCDESCPWCDGTGWEEDDPERRTSRPCRGRVAG